MDASRQPSVGFATQPIHSFKMGFERVDALNRAIGPFRVDGPIITVAQNYAENRSAHSASDIEQPNIDYTAILHAAIDLRVYTSIVVSAGCVWTFVRSKAA